MSTFPRCLFTVTTGRSGSNYLTELLARCQGVVATHEPRPNFVHCMRHVQLHPDLAREFLVEDKLPAISYAARGKIYAETSHLFCKGFLEAWVQLPDVPVPDLILLNRDYRKVALSMLSLGTTPARTLRGAKWYLSPADATCYTQIPDWQSLDDYQLCYWYCLEIDERKRLYRELVTELGGRAVAVELTDLNSTEGFEKLRRDLALPGVGVKGRLLAFLQRNRPVNTKAKKKVEVNYAADRLTLLEQEVEERICVNRTAQEHLATLRQQLSNRAQR